MLSCCLVDPGASIHTSGDTFPVMSMENPFSVHVTVEMTQNNVAEVQVAKIHTKFEVSCEQQFILFFSVHLPARCTTCPVVSVSLG